jgi:hypothetical protein
MLTPASARAVLDAGQHQRLLLGSDGVAGALQRLTGTVGILDEQVEHAAAAGHGGAEAVDVDAGLAQLTPDRSQLAGAVFGLDAEIGRHGHHPLDVRRGSAPPSCHGSHCPGG